MTRRDEPLVDWYAYLDVAPDASAAEIAAAYRRLARALHPDSAPANDADVERLQAVVEAHGILSDPDRRRAYDDARRGRPAQRARERAPCPVCRGDRSIAVPCDRCWGTGNMQLRTALLAIPRRCHVCGGAGRRAVRCGACAGAGYTI